MQSTSSVRTFRPSAPEEPGKPKKERNKKPSKQRSAFTSSQVRRKMPWIIVLLLLVISVFMFVQYRQAQHKLQSNTPNAAKQQSHDVVQRVGKLMILPKDQTPTVATVLDVKKLEGQAFFADAHNGDKVLVYNTTKRAILYRPSTNQIVNVSTVSVAPK